MTDLPDANTFPTWGALRERVLISCKEIKIRNTASLRDAFCNELVKLSPPELVKLDFSGSSNLHNFVVSPATACPKLNEIDLSECSSLEYALIQSQSVQTLTIKGCGSLQKVLIHCPRVTKLVIQNNTKLETIMIWSDDLSELDLSGCTNIYSLQLQCPSLLSQNVPPLKYIEEHIKPVHQPISFVLKEQYAEAQRLANEEKEREWKSEKAESSIAKVHRGFNLGL